MRWSDAELNEIVAAVGEIASYSPSAYSRSIDPLDQREQPIKVGDAWQSLQRYPTLADYIKVRTRTNPYNMPRRRPNQSPLQFVENLTEDADTDVDSWDCGIRAGLSLSVPAEIAEAIANRLFSATVQAVGEANGDEAASVTLKFGG